MGELKVLESWLKEYRKLYEKYKSSRAEMASISDNEELVEEFRLYSLKMLETLSKSSLVKKKDSKSGNKSNYYFEIPSTNNSKYYLIEIKVSELKKGVRVDMVDIHQDNEYRRDVSVTQQSIRFGNKGTCSIFPNSGLMRKHKYYRQLGSFV